MECEIEFVGYDENGLKLIQKECFFTGTTDTLPTTTVPTTSPVHELPATGSELTASFAAIVLVVTGIVFSRISRSW